MISIVIVNWNSGQLLQRCVSCLLAHAEGSEIIVVDNASQDGSMDGLARLGPEVTVVRNDTNSGFAAACNAGWRRTRSRAVLFLNPDTECLPEATRRLAEALESDERIWAAAGMLLSPSGNPQQGFNVRPFPTVRSVAAEMFFLDEMWPGNPWTGRVLIRSGETLADIEQPAAACLMVRREALDCTGGFDEGFVPAWFEDVDLCKRIRDRGMRIVFQPAARFLHRGGYSVGRLGYDQFVRFYRTNQIRYFAKHYGQTQARRVRSLIGAGMFLRSALSLVTPLAARSSRVQSALIFWRAGCHFLSSRDAAP